MPKYIKIIVMNLDLYDQTQISDEKCQPLELID